MKQSFARKSAIPLNLQSRCERSSNALRSRRWAIFPAIRCVRARGSKIDLGRLGGDHGVEVRFAKALDVFEPPVHIRLLDQVAKLRSADPSLNYEAIGRLLQVSGMSIRGTVAYAKCMREAGWTEPFQILQEDAAERFAMGSSET